MKKEKELLHKFIDHELSQEEEREFKARLSKNKSLAEEIERFEGVLSQIEKLDEFVTSEDFTERIIEEVRGKKTRVLEIIKDFFLMPRFLRWRVATLPLVFIFIAIVSVVSIESYKFLKSMDLSKSSQMVPILKEAHIKFVYHNPGAKNIYLVGDFNKWRVGEIKLLPKGEGFWSISIPLQPGRYQYMFVVNGSRWVLDPLSQGVIDDGFGNKNGVVLVGS